MNWRRLVCGTKEAVMVNKQKLEIYLDTVHNGETKEGSWAVFIKLGDEWKVTRKYHSNTLPNVLPFYGAIETLEGLTKSFDIVLYTDSQLMAKGYNEWIQTWITNGWRTSDKKPVCFKEEWIKLIELSKQHNLSVYWVSKFDKTSFYMMAEKHAHKALISNNSFHGEFEIIDHKRIVNELIPC